MPALRATVSVGHRSPKPGACGRRLPDGVTLVRAARGDDYFARARPASAPFGRPPDRPLVHRTGCTCRRSSRLARLSSTWRRLASLGPAVVCCRQTIFPQRGARDGRAANRRTIKWRPADRGSIGSTGFLARVLRRPDLIPPADRHPAQPGLAAGCSGSTRTANRPSSRHYGRAWSLRGPVSPRTRKGTCPEAVVLRVGRGAAWTPDAVLGRSFLAGAARGPCSARGPAAEEGIGALRAGRDRGARRPSRANPQALLVQARRMATVSPLPRTGTPGAPPRAAVAVSGWPLIPLAVITRTCPRWWRPAYGLDLPSTTTARLLPPGLGARPFVHGVHRRTTPARFGPPTRPHRPCRRFRVPALLLAVSATTPRQVMGAAHTAGNSVCMGVASCNRAWESELPLRPWWAVVAAVVGRPHANRRPQLRPAFAPGGLTRTFRFAMLVGGGHCCWRSRRPQNAATPCWGPCLRAWRDSCGPDAVGVLSVGRTSHILWRGPPRRGPAERRFAALAFVAPFLWMLSRDWIVHGPVPPSTR